MRRRHTPTAICRPLLCFLAMALTACDAERTPDGAPAAGEALAARHGSVTLTVGRAEGEGPDVFGRVGGVAMDGEGNLLVADAQADEIRVFDGDGELLYRFGGSGEGPGELSDPCCLTFGPEGLLWVRDGGNARYSAFRLSGDSALFVESRRMAHGDVNRWAPVTFDEVGRLVDVGIGSMPGSSEPILGRFHLAAGGEVQERQVLETPSPAELGGEVLRRESTTLYFWPPYGRGYLMAHGPGGWWAEAFTSGYEVRVHGPGGETGMIRGPRIQGPELDAEEQESARQRIEEIRRTAGTDFGFTVPGRKQPLRGIFYDADGRLWVELSAPRGENRIADLFEPDGGILERRSWPAEVTVGLPGWSRGDVAVGVVTDSLGVERVVRLGW